MPLIYHPDIIILSHSLVDFWNYVMLGLLNAVKQPTRQSTIVHYRLDKVFDGLLPDQSTTSRFKIVGRNYRINRGTPCVNRCGWALGYCCEQSSWLQQMRLTALAKRTLMLTTIYASKRIMGSE